MSNELYGSGRQSFLTSKWTAASSTDADWTESPGDLYSILVSRQVSNGANEYYGAAVSGCADNGSGLIRVTLSSGESGWATGDRVSIMDIGGVAESEGNWTVTRQSDTVFDLQGSTFSTGPYTSGGTVVNLGTDLTLNDIPVNSRVTTSPPLMTSQTAVRGVADAADVVFTSVSGYQVDCVVLYHDGGPDTSSTLIAYFDTGTGFPLTPNGNNVQVTWDTEGIFKL